MSFIAQVRYLPVEEVVIVITDLYLTSAAEAASIRGVELPGLARIAPLWERQVLEQGWRPWLARLVGAGRSRRARRRIDRSRMRRADCTGCEWPNGVDRDAGASRRGLCERASRCARLLQVDLEARRALAAGLQYRIRRVGLPARGGCLLAGLAVLGPRIDDLDTVEPARILGASVTEALPAASTAPTLRWLVAEIEMWLHSHRSQCGARGAGRLPITALWLWGGGARAKASRSASSRRLASDTTDTVPASVVRGAALGGHAQSAVPAWRLATTRTCTASGA